MNSSLRILFAGSSQNHMEDICKILTASGYKPLAEYAGNTDDAEQLLIKKRHFRLVMLLPTRSSAEQRKLVSTMSRSGLPWIYLYEQAKRDEIYRLLQAGCNDCIDINGLDRLEFAVCRILKENRREKLNQSLRNKLLKEKNNLEQTVKSMGDGIMTVDINGRIAMMNRSAEKITGWPSEVAMRTTFSEVFRIIEKTTDKPLNDLVTSVIISKEQKGLRKDTVLVTRDGIEKYISASISPMPVFNNRPGAVIVFRDITRIREAEIGLRRYQLLSDCANDIILFSDMDGRIIDANSSALRAYGFSRDEMLGRSLFEFVKPDKRLPVRIPLPDTNSGGIYYEALATRKDGSKFSVEVSQQGAEVGKEKILLSIQRDNTERKHVQEELERARQTAEAANQAKSEFLANMSHEIRTPLNGMLGMIDLTLNTELTEMQRDNLIIAKGCASSLLNLINDVLDFSKIEARKLTLEVIGFDLADLLERIVKPHRIKAEEKSLDVRYKVDHQIPQVVYGDPNRLQQVLNNLIGNAVKFTEKGSIAISAEIRKENKNSFLLEFQVSDTGIGIEPKHITKIFDTFIQADSSITRRFGGSGLGLAISKRLVEMMGGSIWVESEPGRGSNFHFTVELPKTAKQEIIKTNNSHAPTVKKGLKILLAEDDSISSIVTSRILTEAGQMVTHVSNGTEVLKAMEKEQYDMILMDIQMPNMNGLEAVQKIREKERTTQDHIPIIAVTAHALMGDREKYLSQGMDEYVSKPLQIDDLLNKISRLAGCRTKGEKTEVRKVGVHGGNNESTFQKQENMALALKGISGNVGLLGKALEEKNLLLVEKYAHDVKLLSEETHMTGLKVIAFRMELAARREDLDAVYRHYFDLMNVLIKTNGYKQ